MQFEKENTYHGQLYNSVGLFHGGMSPIEENGRRVHIIPEQALTDPVIRRAAELFCAREDLIGCDEVRIEKVADWNPPTPEEKLARMKARWAHEGLMTPYSDDLIEEFKAKIGEERTAELVAAKQRNIDFGLKELAELEDRQLARQREHIRAYWATKGIEF